MISKKINQILKIGIFILITFSSFLLFPKLVKAWCSPACDSSKGFCSGLTESAVDQCNGGVDLGCPCGCTTRFANSCDDTCVICKSGTCYAKGSGIWAKCNKCPDTTNFNGRPCAMFSASNPVTEWNCTKNSEEGVWDASEKKCVQCNGKLENKICGNAGTKSIETCKDSNGDGIPDDADHDGIPDYCISLGCTVAGNGKCESACDPSVSPKCDEKTPGDPCGIGGTCDANCKCIGEVIPSQCSDGIDNDGDGKIDFPADPGCTDASDNDETDVASCKTGPTYTCPAEMKCPTCPEELQGGLVPCGRMCDDPCTAECECAPCTLCHLFVLFKRIIDFLAKDVLFPLAVLMIVVGGVMFLTAAGDPGRMGTAKKILTSVLIGLIIIFLAWLIVDTIIMFITKSGSPLQNWKTINCPLPEESAGPCMSDANCSSPTPFCRNGKCTIIGDVDGDCDVDNDDLNLCNAHKNENWPPCDWDKNGIVDIGDLATVGANVGNTCP